jgi:hypothetical protein
MTLKPLWRAGLLLAVVTASFTASASDRAGWLRDIRVVSAEGQGNAAASVAWQKLTSSPEAALLPTLEAMDGANDYALNWLRSAVDTIAAREIKAGRPLPTAELGKFLLETSHHPRARRLAFELLVQVDSTTADQLLAGMLNDPSLEIRRDAVEKLVGQANQSLARSNLLGAGLLFQQALNYARDVQQIEGIAKKLNALGRPVDLLSHFGFLADWKIIGPFDNAGNVGFEKSYAPEQEINFTAEYDGKSGKVRWQDYASRHKYGMVDMNQPYGKLKEVLAYAATEFYSDRAQPVELRLGGKNSWKVWLNGKLLFARDEYHTSSEIDQYPMPTQLEPGWNKILVKVCQNELVKEWTEEWQFQLRVTDALGTPIVSAKPFRPIALPGGSANPTLKNP